MPKKLIITIARQYGSGGREIGEKVAAALGIPLYDKEIIKDAAAQGDLHVDVIKKSEETAANSLLYTLAMGSNVFGASMAFGYKMPLNDKLFILQSDIIKGYAKEGSCVVIGRCADYVLRDESNILRIFVFGDLDHRQERVMEGQVVDIISKTDKRRASYYNFYTGQKWGKFDNYDLTVNSSTLGIDGIVNSIVDIAKKMME